MNKPIKITDENIDRITSQNKIVVIDAWAECID